MEVWIELPSAAGSPRPPAQASEPRFPLDAQERGWTAGQVLCFVPGVTGHWPAPVTVPISACQLPPW